MKNLRTAASLALTATLAIALTACTTYGPGDNGGGNLPIRPANNGIDGGWMDANGITSSFNGGVFETRTTDTNEKLAEGNYRYLSPRLVEIDMRSIVRGTTSKVNCALVTTSQLNCTTSTGSQFSLTRKA
ncbi:outer membrane lipoprotein Omp10 [Pseudochrobactrum sp. MP213Fo]|uniref:outer membrane lipoprotein Omp10 n=1 Tax=Pseudochrobactrum sp. MP213Fo TaxID=3022250 RepID=UPI003BA367B8